MSRIGNVGHGKVWSGWAGKGPARHGKELETVDRELEIVLLRVSRIGNVGQGKVWSGWAGEGPARHGKELETVDRVLVTVSLRVLGRDRYGEAGSGSARANVAAIGLVTVLCPMQTVHQLT